MCIRDRASGAGPVRAFFNVVVPIVWPSFIVAGLFSFLNAFDNLLTPLFVGGKYQTVDFHPELTRVIHREVTHLGLC